MLTSDDAAAETWGVTASTGRPFTHASIAGAHFRACRQSYRELLGLAGIRTGMRVLDAGCCGGEFLPWLTALTGPGGRVSAIDLDPEHVARAGARVAGWDLPCPVDLRQGSITGLPYADDTFDAVWCSNTVELLTDDQLRVALAELRRVTRPGGLITIKDVDAACFAVRPGDPHLFADLFRAAGATPGYAQQVLRARDLYRWMREAGIGAVRQRTVLIEHFAPFTPDVRAYYAPAFAELAGQATGLGLPAADWAPLLDPGHPQNPFHHPDGYISEGNVLAIGTA
ncbi:methyltransferase domain-containing protein [Actinoplanes sp. NPDC051851]|uniref:class I SAM-dependent methyltransferase n=1 Tax=Actinoplanes sp. NPDC051851 TaxID=3154753 RepID=UPI00341D4728